MPVQIKQPDTSLPPDNNYFDSKVISWNFPEGVNGNQATLGVIQPDFEEVFPVSEGGEEITLRDPEEGSQLVIDELDEAGEVEQSHRLTQEGEQVFVAGGKNMRVSTAGKVVEYLCVYPGQPQDG